ncbi:DUF551 domain-containing protein [Klebsiella oxytoca]|nr:DUF551 domain-containing protein [Klebsiella oxytoca]
MKDETLLPCPFCGSNKCEAFAQDEDDCPYHSAIVRCFNCDAQSAQMVGKDKISRAIAAWNKRPAIQSGNSEQVPAGYVLVPVEPTQEMIWAAKSVLKHTVGWDSFVELYKAMIAAAPLASDGWIPVSERMPPSRHEVLVGRWWGERPRWCCKWATYIPGHPDAQSSGWLIPGASWTPTHWMPLPAAPQEVSDA